jgi:hypothetical protein
MTKNEREKSLPVQSNPELVKTLEEDIAKASSRSVGMAFEITSDDDEYFDQDLTPEEFAKQREKLSIIFDAIINMRREEEGLPPFKPGEVEAAYAAKKLRLIEQENAH